MAGLKTLGFAVGDHSPLSWKLYRFISDMDYENGDTFCFKAGGDGDNGELLLAYLDEWFKKTNTECVVYCIDCEHSVACPLANSNKFVCELLDNAVVSPYDYCAWAVSRKVT